MENSRKLSKVFEVVIILEGNVNKKVRITGERALNDLRMKLTNTRGKDVVSTVLNPTGKGGQCSYNEHVPFGLEYPFINLTDYNTKSLASGILLDDIIYTNKIVAVSVIQLSEDFLKAEERGRQGNGE